MTHNTYNLFSANRIIGYNDIHAILTHTFEKIDSNFSKEKTTNYFPNFKIVNREQNCLTIATNLNYDKKLPGTFTYDFFDKKNNKKQNSVKIESVNNIENYQFNLNDIVDVCGTVSYSKHLTKAKLTGEVNVKNERIVWFEKNKIEIDKLEILNFFTRYGLEIDFQKETYFKPIYSYFNVASSDKKRFKDIFEYEFTARITDFAKVNLLSHVSIGRARSYGFGAVWVALA